MCPKVCSVEDDRWIMPFVALQTSKAQGTEKVTSIWFVMLNLKEFTVERTIDLNLTNLELEELEKNTSHGHQQFTQIQIC